jgi:predicted dienelactone hydrolase
VLRQFGLALFVVLVLVVIAVFALRQILIAVGRTSHSVTQIDIAGRRVAMWKPAGPPPPGGYPAILFSHGFMGCSTQSIFLTEGLAQAGYFVLAPDHRDATCGEGHERWRVVRLATLRAQKPFRNPRAWSEGTYRDRGADLEAILDTILREKSFQGVPIDSTRIGLAGHSLGGYTVLALAGAWPGWKDRRVKAVLGLSPYCAPFIASGTLARLGVPVMYQGGTLDLGVTPYLRRPGGAYDQTAPPKYFVEFAGASHFAWTNLSNTYRDMIIEYAAAFFGRYLKPAASPDPLDKLLERPWPQEVKTARHELR